MAFTLGVGPATNETVSGATTSLVLTLNGTTAGRNLVLGTTWARTSVAPTITSITVSGESNMTLVGSPADSASSGCGGQFAYLNNLSSGGTKTITITYSTGMQQKEAFVYEVIGGDLTSAFLGATAETVQDVAATNASHTLTTLHNNSIIFSMLRMQSALSNSVGAGYTNIAYDTNFGTGEYKLDAGTAGGNTVNFTNASTRWILKSVEFVLADPNIVIRPTAGSLSLSGNAPRIINSANPVIIPTSGSLTFTGSQPPVGLGIVPTAAALAFTGRAPLVSLLTSPTIVPGSGSLSLSGFAPSQDISVGNTLIVPGAGSLAFTGFSGGPALNGPVSLEAITGYGIHYAGTLATGAGTLEFITSDGLTVPFGYATGAGTLEALTGFGMTVTGGGLLEQITAFGRADNIAYGAGTLEAIRASDSIAAGYAILERIVATGIGSAAISAVYTTKVMNTRAAQVTEYQNYNFNSYTKIGDFYYGAGPSGLYKLDGTDDNGTNIDWRLRLGQLDDKQQGLKRLPEILMTLRASGPVRVRVYKDDNVYFDYMLPAVKTNTIHTARVKPGKGMRSRYYMVEIQGVAGADLELDSMLISMTKTSRRLG